MVETSPEEEEPELAAETEPLLGKETSCPQAAHVLNQMNDTFVIGVGVPQNGDKMRTEMEQQLKMIEDTEKLAEAWFQMKPVRMQCKRTITGLVGLVFLLTMLMFTLEYIFFFPYGNVFAWGWLLIGGILLVWTVSSIIYGCKVCSKLRINNIILFMPMYLEAIVCALLLISFAIVTLIWGLVKGVCVLYCINALLLLKGIFENVEFGLIWVTIGSAICVGFATSASAVRRDLSNKHFPWIYSLLPFSIAALLLLVYFARTLVVSYVHRNNEATDNGGAEFYLARKKFAVHNPDSLESGDDRQVEDELKDKDRNQCILTIVATKCCGKPSTVYWAGLMGSFMLTVAIIQYAIKLDFLSALLLPKSSIQDSLIKRFDLSHYKLNQWVLVVTSSLSFILLAIPFGELFGSVAEAIGFDFMNLTNRNRHLVLKRSPFDMSKANASLSPNLIKKLIKAQRQRPSFHPTDP